MASPLPVPREPDSHPNHHLWRNGRLWWIAFTIHRGPFQQRVRHSLGTADVAEARVRRDEVLARYAREPGCALSLRFEPPRRRRGAASEREVSDRGVRLVSELGEVSW